MTKEVDILLEEVMKNTHDIKDQNITIDTLINVSIMAVGKTIDILVNIVCNETLPQDFRMNSVNQIIEMAAIFDIFAYYYDKKTFRNEEDFLKVFKDINMPIIIKGVYNTLHALSNIVEQVRERETI